MDQLERLAHPSSVLQPAGVVPARGTNRGWLTVVLTIVSLVVGAAGAGMVGWKWFGGEQALALNHAGQLLPDARTHAVLDEYEANHDSHPRLKAELKKLREDLTYVPPFEGFGPYEDLAFAVIAERVAAPALERRKLAAEKVDADNSARDHLASVRNHDQDVAKKYQETRSATKQGDMSEGIVTPELVNLLSRSARGAATGDGNVLGMPSYNRRDVVGVPPIARGLSGDLGPGSRRYDGDPYKDRSSPWGTKESTSK